MEMKKKEELSITVYTNKDEILGLVNKLAMEFSVADFKGRVLAAGSAKGGLKSMLWIADRAGMHLEPYRTNAKTYDGVYRVIQYRQRDAGEKAEDGKDKS